MVIRFNKNNILRQNNEGTVFCFDRDFNDRVIIQSKGVFHISKKFAAYLTVLINSEIHESALPRLDIANRKLQQK